jgi:hypothetical protein
MEESFGSSEFIARSLSRKFVNHKGYPALECKFKDKDSSLFLTRFIIKGPHYYTLIAHGKNEVPKMQSFINSFELLPFNYNAVKERVDTSLYFKVKSPVYPEDKKIKLDNAGYGGWFRNFGGDDEDEETEKGKLESGVYRNKIIQNDTTGEKIYVTFFKDSKYLYYSDTTWFEKDKEGLVDADSTWITRYKNKTELPNKVKVWEVQVSDSGSSRMLWGKTFYKDGVGFSIVTQTDTLSKPSAFIKTFFETFTPADTLKGINPFEKKTKVFFDDMFSPDSVVVKRAYRNLSSMEFDSSDLPQLKKAITRMNWDMKKYLASKKELIEKIGEIKNKTATDYLKDLYYAAGDTVELQYTILEAMLRHRTDHAYKIFRDIVTADPPVLNVGDNNYNYDVTINYSMFSGGRTGHSRGLSFSYFNGQFFDELSDTLKLTRTILPDLLPLINLDDYEKPVMNLLEQMVDSNLIKPKDYEIYFSKFLIEAKQLLKKQAIAEKKRQIEKEENKKEDKQDYAYRLNEDSDYGNTELETYAKLMLPFAETNNPVKPVLDQMLNSNDKKLKYHTLLLLIQHKKSYPDTMISYFAKQDEYRYDLYDELKDMKRMDLFPDSFNTHIALGKSRLLMENSYDKPDSVLYLDRLPAEYKGKKGFIYFYKVKPKKDDGFWKIATVGLIPEDPKEFEFKTDEKTGLFFPALSDMYSEIPSYGYDFTRITETKIKEDEPLQGQLSKILKKLLYSKRKSAKKFYSDEDDEGLGRMRYLNYD